MSEQIIAKLTFDKMHNISNDYVKMEIKSRVEKKDNLLAELKRSYLF